MSYNQSDVAFNNIYSKIVVKIQDLLLSGWCHNKSTPEQTAHGDTRSEAPCLAIMPVTKRHYSTRPGSITPESNSLCCNKKPPVTRTEGLKMERAKRFELSTSTLARWCSTNWATLAYLEEVAKNSKFVPTVNVFLKKKEPAKLAQIWHLLLKQ